MTDQTEQFGDAVVTMCADGTIVVEHADPIILVAKELLADPGRRATYVDDVLTIDTAGKYRYRRIRSHDEHTDVFHRITPDEQETSA